MAKEAYPIEEFVRLKEITDEIKSITDTAARYWCQTRKYPHAKKIGKHWLVHPVQFKRWWKDGGPGIA